MPGDFLGWGICLGSYNAQLVGEQLFVDVPMGMRRGEVLFLQGQKRTGLVGGGNLAAQELGQGGDLLYQLAVGSGLAAPLQVDVILEAHADVAGKEKLF